MSHEVVVETGCGRLAGTREDGLCVFRGIPFVMGQIGTRGGDRFAGGGPEAERLQARMMDSWLGFARDGDPGHADLASWDAFDPARRATMIFGRECEARDDPLGSERAAWDGIL